MGKKYSYILLIGLFIVVTSITSAQSQSGKGVVILNNEEVIFGHVNYHQEYEMVSVTKNDKELAYNATQVKLFQYYDQEKSLNRIYRPFKESSTYRYSSFKTPEFFELVLMDDVTILRKMKTVIMDANPENDKSPIHTQDILPHKSEAIDYDYYVSTDGTTASLIRDFKEQIVERLPSVYQPPLYQYIAENKLYLKVWNEQFELLEYYQQLKERDQGNDYFFAEPIKL